MLPEPRCLLLRPTISQDHLQLLRSGLTTTNQIIDIMAQNPKGLNEFRTGLNRIAISKENTVLIPQQADVIEIEIRIRGFHGESIYKVQDSKAMGRSYPWNKARVPNSQIIQKGKAILSEKEKKLESLRAKALWKEEGENNDTDDSLENDSDKQSEPVVKFNALAKPFTPRAPLTEISHNEQNTDENIRPEGELRDLQTSHPELRSQIRAPGKKPKKRSLSRKVITSTPYPRRLAFEDESVTMDPSHQDVDMTPSQSLSPVPPSINQPDVLAQSLPPGIGYLDDHVVTQVEDAIKNLSPIQGPDGESLENWLESHSLQ